MHAGRADGIEAVEVGRLVIRVAVDFGRDDDQGRLPRAEEIFEGGSWAGQVFFPQGEDTGVGQAQGFGADLAAAQQLQCVLSLGAAAGAPAGALGGVDEPAPFDEALRPRVVVAVGHEDDPDLGPRGQGLLDQPACAERLVVRVGREDGDLRARMKLVLQPDGRCRGSLHWRYRCRPADALSRLSVRKGGGPNVSVRPSVF